MKGEPLPGNEVTIEWNGRTVAAWVPDPLRRRESTLSEPTARLTEQAAAAARRGDDALPREWHALARLLLRAEGVASSFVEGVRAPLADIAAAELDPSVGETAAWVADNLTAAAQAIAAARREPLRIDLLHEWHRQLMAGSSHLPERLIGATRDLQGWIGGSSPLDAALVTPPPERIEPLLSDLVAFANRSDLDPVTQAALAHAQFELIHPYADGNGRVGRILVGWILTRRLRLSTPPPISVRIATDRGGYLSGLTLFRLGQVDPWVAWFADVVARSGEAATGLVRSVGELQAAWADRLTELRTDAAARHVIALLPAHPVLSTATVAAELTISERAARRALSVLAAHRVLEPFVRSARSPGRQPRWWVASELLSLVSAWSR